MNEQVMKDRTKAFAIRVVRLVESLPRTRAADVIGRQVLRSATSVGANYRAARRAKSTADFISKLGTVEEESDESAYWLELLAESELVKRSRLTLLMKECNEIWQRSKRRSETGADRLFTSDIRHPTSDISGRTAGTSGSGRTGPDSPSSRRGSCPPAPGCTPPL